MFLQGVLAGRPFVDEIFSQCGCKVEWCLDEGDAFERIAIVARVTGPARMILIGERVALNTLARASGIATRLEGFLFGSGVWRPSSSVLPTHYSQQCEVLNNCL